MILPPRAFGMGKQSLVRLLEKIYHEPIHHIDARVFFWQESFFKQSMLYLHRKNRQPWFHLGFVEVSRNCLSGGDYGVSGIPEVSLSFEIPPAIPTFDPFRREILRQYCIKNWSCNYNCCHVCVLKPSSNHSNGYGPKVNIKIAGKWMFIPQKWYKEWQYIVIYRYIVCDSVCVLYIYICVIMCIIRIMYLEFQELVLNHSQITSSPLRLRFLFVLHLCQVGEAFSAMATTRVAPLWLHATDSWVDHKP